MKKPKLLPASEAVRTLASKYIIPPTLTARRFRELILNAVIPGAVKENNRWFVEEDQLAELAKLLDLKSKARNTK
jgi:hypothetical protein